MTEFPVFKKIPYGGIPKKQLIAQLEKAGVQFNKYAHVLFDHSSFTSDDARKEVQLVKVTPSDLQLTAPPVFQEIVDAASRFGLSLCPLALGAFLRLEYLDQPEGPYLTIASAKPTADEEPPRGLYVRNLEGTLWLRGYRASDDYAWPMESEFIFSRDKLK